MSRVKTAGGRSASSCPVCRVALAPDRLESEFPPADRTTAVSSSLTIQDVLRETAASPSFGATTPLDEQVQRFRKSFWEHDQVPEDSSAPPFKRIGGRWTPRFDMVLGFGALAAVMLVVTGVLIHAIWQSGRGMPPDALMLAQIASPAVSIRAKQNEAGKPPSGMHAAKPAAGAARIDPLPSKIGGWRLWTSAAGQSANDSRVAFYQQGQQVVELTLIKTPRMRPVLRHPLLAFADSTRIVASTHGSVRATPRELLRYGRDCLFFDYAPSSASAPWRIVTSNPYLPSSPYTISWYTAPYVVTVGADTGKVRDAFAQAYLSSEKR